MTFSIFNCLFISFKYIFIWKWYEVFFSSSKTSFTILLYTCYFSFLHSSLNLFTIFIKSSKVSNSLLYKSNLSHNLAKISTVPFVFVLLDWHSIGWKPISLPNCFISLWNFLCLSSFNHYCWHIIKPYFSWRSIKIL